MVQQIIKHSDFMRDMMEKACKEFNRSSANRTFNLTGLSCTIMNRVGMKGVIHEDKLKEKIKDRKDIRPIIGSSSFELLDKKGR
jgi:hypothetical protein